jgi:hypothetical protein
MPFEETQILGCLSESWRDFISVKRAVKYGSEGVLAETVDEPPAFCHFPIVNPQQLISAIIR